MTFRDKKGERDSKGTKIYFKKKEKKQSYQCGVKSCS